MSVKPCETCGGLGYDEKVFEMAGIKKACPDCKVKRPPPKPQWETAPILKRIKPGDYEYAGYYIRRGPTGRWRYGPLPQNKFDKRFITDSYGHTSLKRCTGDINYYRHKYGPKPSAT